MAYELWDIESANLVGDYLTAEAALAVVRDSVRAFGPGSIASLALAFEDTDGETHPIAAGQALAELAERGTPAQSAS